MSASRQVAFAGRVVAVESGVAGNVNSTWSFKVGDEQGTAQLSIDAVSMAVTRRYVTPFGGARGGPRPVWPDDHGFLNKVEDPGTSLTHVGAREYDATVGQFLSVDPLLDAGDVQSLNGYVYGSNNPMAFPDPTGLDAFDSPSLCAYRSCAPSSNSSRDDMNPQELAARSGSRGAGSYAEPVRNGRVTYIPVGLNVVDFCEHQNTVQCRAQFDPSFPIKQAKPQDDYQDRQLLLSSAAMIPGGGVPLDALAAADSIHEKDYLGATLSGVGIFFEGADFVKAVRAARALRAVNTTEQVLGELGDARTYVNLTRRNSIRNVGTDATHAEFVDTLERAGWTSSTSKNGDVQIMQKDGAKFVLRSKNSSGYEGWTADFTPAGSKKHTVEIRLGYKK